MEHPTRQAEHIDVMTRALAIAAKEAAAGDVVKACASMDRWLLEASNEYTRELLKRAIEKAFLEGSGGEKPCGLC